MTQELRFNSLLHDFFFIEGESRVEFKELTDRICLLGANSSVMKFTLIVKVFTGK